jgi:hypothetical protein
VSGQANHLAILTGTAQVEQLRLSERDFENLGQIGDGQFGSVSESFASMGRADSRSRRYDVDSTDRCMQ